jgi:hypothetical protein
MSILISYVNNYFLFGGAKAPEAVKGANFNFINKRLIRINK